MKPSRTYNLARMGIACLTGLAVLLAVVMLYDLEAGKALVETWSTYALSIAGLASAGVGAMAARDYGSGGLTSSQGEQVLESQRIKA